jgi:alkylation response protein AidB-like acyl-CoA dehydrogenase
LAQEVPAVIRWVDCWVLAEFSLKLGARGWIGLTWPWQYGGQSRSYLDRVVLTEELLRAGARWRRTGWRPPGCLLASLMAVKAEGGDSAA